MENNDTQPTLNKAYLQDAQPYLDERLQNPKFRKIYEEESLKIQIAQTVYKKRKALKLTRAMLAKRAKTKKKMISRIEWATVFVSVGLLQRIAHAMDSKVLISFEEIAHTDKKSRDAES